MVGAPDPAGAAGRGVGPGLGLAGVVRLTDVSWTGDERLRVLLRLLLVLLAVGWVCGSSAVLIDLISANWKIMSPDRSVEYAVWHASYEANVTRQTVVSLIVWICGALALAVLARFAGLPRVAIGFGLLVVPFTVIGTWLLIG